MQTLHFNFLPDANVWNKIQRVCAVLQIVVVNVQYIEATDLEMDMKRENPVRYHEAWQQLCSSSGVLIPGGFGIRGLEGKILAAEWARKTKKPYLGTVMNVCLLVKVNFPVCCHYIGFLLQDYLFVLVRVATNLEYSGISLNMENSEFSGNSVQPQGKIVTIVCHSNICVKQLLTG